MPELAHYAARFPLPQDGVFVRLLLSSHVPEKGTERHAGVSEGIGLRHRGCSGTSHKTQSGYGPGEDAKAAQDSSAFAGVVLIHPEAGRTGTLGHLRANAVKDRGPSPSHPGNSRGFELHRMASAWPEGAPGYEGDGSRRPASSSMSSATAEKSNPLLPVALAPRTMS